jgi:hypothetical protein
MKAHNVTVAISWDWDMVQEKAHGRRRKQWRTLSSPCCHIPPHASARSNELKHLQPCAWPFCSSHCISWRLSCRIGSSYWSRFRGNPKNRRLRVVLGFYLFFLPLRHVMSAEIAAQDKASCCKNEALQSRTLRYQTPCRYRSNKSVRESEVLLILRIFELSSKV